MEATPAAPAAAVPASVPTKTASVLRCRKDPRTGEFLGTGRRKSAVARVRLRTGTGKITINGRSFETYFHSERDRASVTAPLEKIGQRQALDVIISCIGGGPTGQADSCKMGIARALISLSVDNHPHMRDGGFLTRDSRMKERKKYGLRGARRGTQFSKR